MSNEQDGVLKALRTAINVEVDGKQCYLQAVQVSGNEVGKKLLQELVNEEDAHQQTMLEIYKAIQRKKGWPETHFQPDKGKKLRGLFNMTCKLIVGNIKTMPNEIEAINLALDKEKKSYDFYSQLLENSTLSAEQEFYAELRGEEREHEHILLDYYEYLTDPVDWFTKAEHHSLDGG
jgi:rubrerythrin